ncbi:MAG TPA: hypothetical protein VFQ38_22245 [Longimicrobiales bacterium]|nr:hypothetical protein [Longimicrobiales bacterium]
MANHYPPCTRPAPPLSVLVLLLACGADHSTLPSDGAPLSRIVIDPAMASVAPGGTLRFEVTGVMRDGTSAAVQVSFEATGGTISADGVYSAGHDTGVFTVIAIEPTTRLADTAVVTVTVSAPPPVLPGGPYVKVIGDDWQGYGRDADLKAKKLFGWPDAEDVRNYYALVSDPTFGKGVRITFPQNTGTSGASPRLEKYFRAPLNEMWFRWTMKFTPGWTTVGPEPEGAANSYKIAFWFWEGYWGRGELQYSNSTQYITETTAQDPKTGENLSYIEKPLADSPGDFGEETTEWSDGEWWEFVIHYEKTGPTTARQYYWRRRLTSGGRVVDNPWTWYGYTWSGSTTPQVSGIALGANKNKNNPTTMYLTWGPWEVVDGSKYPNPWNMPNVR